MCLSDSGSGSSGRTEAMRQHLGSHGVLDMASDSAAHCLATVTGGYCLQSSSVGAHGLHFECLLQWKRCAWLAFWEHLGSGFGGAVWLGERRLMAWRILLFSQNPAGGSSVWDVREAIGTGSCRADARVSWTGWSVVGPGSGAGGDTEPSPPGG